MDILRPGQLRRINASLRLAALLFYFILTPHVNAIGNVSLRIPTWHALQPGFSTGNCPLAALPTARSRLLSDMGDFWVLLDPVGISGCYWTQRGFLGAIGPSRDFWVLKALTYLQQWRDACCSALLVPAGALVAINSQYCLEIKEKIMRE